MFEIICVVFALVCLSFAVRTRSRPVTMVTLRPSRAYREVETDITIDETLTEEVKND